LTRTPALSDPVAVIEPAREQADQRHRRAVRVQLLHAARLPRRGREPAPLQPQLCLRLLARRPSAPEPDDSKRASVQAKAHTAFAGCLRCGRQLLVLRAPLPQLTRRRVRAVRPDRRRAIVSFPTPVDDLVSQHIVVETFEIGESVADYLHKAGDAPKITKWKLVGENTWVPADPSHSLEAHFSGTGGTGGTLQAALSPTAAAACRAVRSARADRLMGCWRACVQPACCVRCCCSRRPLSRVAVDGRWRARAGRH
jgi:hypothetical protein